MLRILDSKQLDGYVFQKQSEDAPDCELLAGYVTSIQPLDSLGNIYEVRITGKYFDKNVRLMKLATTKVFFENRGDGRKRLAERLIESRLHKGSFVSVLCMIDDHCRYVLDFKFYGLWRLKGYAGEMNVLFGNPADYRLNRGIAQFKFTDKGNGQFFERFVIVNTAAFREQEYEVIMRKGYAFFICGSEKRHEGRSYYYCNGGLGTNGGNFDADFLY